MQKAIPFKACIPASSGPRPPAVEGQGGPEGTAAVTATTAGAAGCSGVRRAATENAVIVIGRRGCCMCHVAKRLLLGLGVNPAVYEIDDGDEGVVIKELKSMIRADDKDQNGGDSDNDQKLQFPAVFVGGRLFGGLEKMMATHISGELVPILREAGALWL
ncbi:glutaredoxin-C9 [Rhodamnia argentea]|uniref:Glutaredoxin-C9 n=1 Tax=Rhodamnia argentea TaxID=178133 RepID=A0A8B8P1Y3_9MYRT|nr:glutaredoxin-C9 [Rhodamnia argentea]